VRSRQFEQSPSSDVLIYLRDQLIELSGSDISSHLAVPVIIIPAIQAAGDFGSLLEGETRNETRNSALDVFDSLVCRLDRRNFGQRRVSDFHSRCSAFEVKLGACE
jgi:hypothetical protein